jgi:putative ATPase
MSAPLAHILRPQSLDEIVGQQHLIGPNGPLRRIIESGTLPNMIWYSNSPGVGKTTLAKILPKLINAQFIHINASHTTQAEVRKAISGNNRQTVLIIDEIHRLNRTVQQSLLEAIETGKATLLGLTATNAGVTVDFMILSRVTLFKFEPLSNSELLQLFEKALLYVQHLNSIQFEPEVVKIIIQVSNGDGRKLISMMEVLATIGKDNITINDIEFIKNNKALFSEENLYDYLSCIQGSIQASDPDSAVYWLGRALEAGVDIKKDYNK